MRRAGGASLLLVLVACASPKPTRRGPPDASSPTDGPSRDAPRGDAPSRTDAGDARAPDAGTPFAVTMNAYDARGSGANTREAYLNIANVGSSSFGALFARAVDGDQYAQPLYQAGVAFPDGTTRDVVYVATSNDSVYAFDADDPAASAPLWKARVGTPSPLPNRFVGNGPTVAECKRQNRQMRELGVTATPALDPATSTLYVLAATVDDAAEVRDWTCTDIDPTSPAYCTTYACTAPVFRTELHALDARTGAEKPGSPVAVTGSVPGSGAGSAGGTVAYDTMRSFARTALLLAYGNVYFATASYADFDVYHGWVFAYDAATLAPGGVWNDTSDGESGGIWQSGRSLLADGLGYVYAVSGNGTFDANHGGHDYGDSVVKLSSDLSTVADYFSPFLSEYEGNPSYNLLFEWDADLGSAGATMIPGTTLVLVTGKLGDGYVLDTANLGQWSPTSDDIVQELRFASKVTKTACNDGVVPAAMYGTPVAWVGPDGAHVYGWAIGDRLRDYLLDGSGRFATEGVCWCATGWDVAGPDGTRLLVDVPDPPCGVVHSENGEPSLFGGAALSISSNGAKAGTGVLWATRAGAGNAGARVVPGVLEAYDATDLRAPIWSSDTNAARDGLGDWAKFTPPIVANGRVYAPTFSNQLVVYGVR